MLHEPSHLLKVSSPLALSFTSFFIHWTCPFAPSFHKKITFLLFFCLYFPPSVSFHSVVPQGSLCRFSGGIRQHLYNSHCMKLNHLSEKQLNSFQFWQQQFESCPLSWIKKKTNQTKKSVLFSMLLNVSVLQGDNELIFFLICLRTFPWFLIFQLLYSYILKDRTVVSCLILI